MKLKICGIRTQEMLQACEDLDVDFIGINFVKTSKRKVNHSFCNNIAKHKKIKKVGIFQNQEIDEILEIAETWNLDIVQLHGQESPNSVKIIRKKLKPKIQIWKAFLVDENFDLEILQQCCRNCDLLLFDGKNPGSGTQITNKTKLDEVIIESEKLEISYGIAGGVALQNIIEFKTKFSQASLLDTASGVEENGEFCRKKLEQLVQSFKLDDHS